MAKHWKGYEGRGAENRRRGLAGAKDEEPGEENESTSAPAVEERMTLLLSISNHFRFVTADVLNVYLPLVAFDASASFISYLDTGIKV